jgi:hypothetical protein
LHEQDAWQLPVGQQGGCWLGRLQPGSRGLQRAAQGLVQHRQGGQDWAGKLALFTIQETNLTMPFKKQT